jgi:hypothetical protein
LAAAIALRTCFGASAGGMAVPSACSWAVPPGAVGVVVEVVVVLPGDPVPPVWAMAGAALPSDATNSSPAKATLLLSVYDRKPFSFVGLRG